MIEGEVIDLLLSINLPSPVLLEAPRRRGEPPDHTAARPLGFDSLVKWAGMASINEPEVLRGLK